VYPFAKLKLTAGADFRASNTGYAETNVSPSYDTAAPFPIKNTTAQSSDSVHQRQVGIYAAVNYNSTSFNMEVGGRYNHHSVYGSNGAFNFNPSFLIKNQWKLFANLSSGYKTPSLYQLYSEYGNTALKPERSINAEGGLQYFFKQEKGNVRAVYFHRNVKDVIFFFTNLTTYQSQYINQDKQNDQGIELESNVNLTTHLNFKLFYSYVNGKITTKNNGKDTTFFNLLRRPKNSLSTTLGYNFRSAYVSVQVCSFGKRSDVYFDPTTFQSQAVTLKPYTLLNVYAEYGLLKKLKLFADLRNILNKKYKEIYGYSAPRFNGYGGLRFQL
jgi:vitamin B12 transporter